MTKEKIIKTSSALKVIRDEKNQAMGMAFDAFKNLMETEAPDAAEIAKLRKATIEAVDEYNEANLEYIYSTLYERENPMLAACQYGELKVSRLMEKVDDHGTVTVSIDERKNRNALDLVDFESRSQKALFVNGQWIYWASKLAQALAKDLCNSLEISKEESAKVAADYKDAISKGNFGDMTTKRFSKGSIEKDLQQIVNAILMVPDEKKEKETTLIVTSKDVNFLLARRARHGKSALATRAMGEKEIQIVIANIMYHLTTGNVYTVDHK